MLGMGGLAEMSGGGPMITGSWINTKTGERVTVRDSFIDGENIIIQLTNGRQLSMDEFNDYVQMSESDNDEYSAAVSTKASSTAVSSKTSKKNTNADASVVFDGMGDMPDPGMSSLQKQLLAKEIEEFGLPEDTANTAKPAQNPTHTKAMSSNSMVEKLLEKCKSPRLEVKVSWSEFPSSELRMLKTYFGVTDEEIVSAIITKYVNTSIIREPLEEWLDGKL